MLNQHTIERLNQMHLKGMAEALLNHLKNSDFQELSFEERLGLLVDYEYTFRQNRRLARLLAQARLKLPACLEDLDYQHPREIDRTLIRDLSTCQWIESHLNVLITGPSGVGKTYLACALASTACRYGLSARYYRVSALLSELASSKGDGTYLRFLKQLSNFNLLILDDWALAPFSPDQARDMLEVIDARNNTGSMVINSQLPLDTWYQNLPDPTLADAILDRIMHNSYRIPLKGESMRKVEASKKLSNARKKKE
jgi:DNA replication protein DnaC